MEGIIRLCAIAMFSLLCACSTINRSTTPPLQSGAQWAVLPFGNYTQTPMAGVSAKDITTALLQSKGIHNLANYAAKSKAKQSLLPGTEPQLSAQQIMNWASAHHVRYVLDGSVNEWRYKVGIDGEPVAAVTMRLWDAQLGRVIWRSAASTSGKSRQSLGYVAQRLLSNSLRPLVG